MDHQEFELIEEFYRISGLLQRYRQCFYKENGHPFEATRIQERILHLLKGKTDMPKKEISFLLGVPHLLLEKAITMMAQDGLIEVDKANTSELHLTEKGVHASEKSLRKVPVENEGIGQLFSCLNQSEQDQLKEYLHKIVHQLKDLTKTQIPEHNFNHFI